LTRAVSGFVWIVFAKKGTSPAAHARADDKQLGGLVFMSAAVPSAAGPAGSAIFEREAREVLPAVQRALEALIQALPGEIRRAAHLQQLLGLDSALGWQVYRAATSDDVLGIGRHLPGPVAMARVLEASARLGVSEELIGAARRTYRLFEELIQRHAGDQRTMITLLEAIGGERGEAHDLKERRAAFRANARLWGVQSRARIVCTIMHPGSCQRTVDAVSVDGMVDLCSLRRGVEVRIGHKRVHDVEELVTPLEEMEPGLIPDFCSGVLPPLLRRLHQDGAVDVVMMPEALGKSGAISYFCRHDAPAVSQGEPDTIFSFNSFVAIPTEVQYVDALLPRGWADPSTALAVYFACMHDPKACFLRRPEDRFEGPARAVYLGRGVERLRAPEFERYPELISRILAQVGWDPQGLELFRVRVEYPLLHSSTMLTARAPGEEEGWR
jgi:hypothetical protein